MLLAAVRTNVRQPAWHTENLCVCVCVCEEWMWGWSSLRIRRMWTGLKQDKTEKKRQHIQHDSSRRTRVATPEKSYETPEINENLQVRLVWYPGLSYRTFLTGVQAARDLKYSHCWSCKEIRISLQQPNKKFSTFTSFSKAACPSKSLGVPSDDRKAHRHCPLARPGFDFDRGGLGRVW